MRNPYPAGGFEPADVSGDRRNRRMVQDNDRRNRRSCLVHRTVSRSPDVPLYTEHQRASSRRKLWEHQRAQARLDPGRGLSGPVLAPIRSEGTSAGQPFSWAGPALKRALRDHITPAGLNPDA